MRTLFLLSSFSCARGYPCNVRKLGLGRFYLNLLKDQDTYRGLNEWALCVIKPSSGTSAVTYCMCTTPLEAQACVSSAVGPCHDVDIGRFAKKSPFFKRRFVPWFRAISKRKTMYDRDHKLLGCPEAIGSSGIFALSTTRASPSFDHDTSRVMMSKRWNP